METPVADPEVRAAPAGLVNEDVPGASRWLALAPRALLAAGAVVLFALNIGPLLASPGLAAYPFISFDGFQWISDGLYLAGQYGHSIGRNPGYPALVAALTWLGALDLAIWLNPAALALFCVYVYRLVRLLVRPEVALATVVVVLFNARLVSFFLWILADPFALTFMTAACFYLCRALRGSSSFAPFLLCAGLSALFQSAVVFSMFGAAAAFVWFTPDVRKAVALLKPQLWRLGVGAIPFLLFATWKLAGPPSGVVQFGLLGFNLSGAFFYLWAVAVVFGWIALVAAASLFRSGWSADRTLQTTFLFVLPQLVLWIFFYRWHDVRFTLYFAPLLLAVLALAIERFFQRVLESWRQRNWIGLSAWTVVAFLGISALQFPAGSPFDQQTLPLTSQVVLTAGTQPITRFGGNQTVNLRGLALEFPQTWPVLLSFPRTVKRALAASAADHAPLLEVSSAARTGADGAGVAARIRMLRKTDGVDERRVLMLEAVTRP